MGVDKGTQLCSPNPHETQNITVTPASVLVLVLVSTLQVFPLSKRISVGKIKGKCMKF